MTLKDLVEVTYIFTDWIICSNGCQVKYSTANEIPDKFLLCKIEEVEVINNELQVTLEADSSLW